MPRAVPRLAVPASSGGLAWKPPGPERFASTAPSMAFRPKPRRSGISTKVHLPTGAGGSSSFGFCDEAGEARRGQEIAAQETCNRKPVRLSGTLSVRVKAWKERFYAVRRKSKRNRSLWSFRREHPFFEKIIKHSPRRTLRKARNARCLTSLDFPTH